MRQAITKEKKEVEKQIKRIEKEQKKLPEGHLLIKRDRKYYKWFNSYKRKQTYIKKSEKEYAMQLAKKTLYEKKLKRLKKQKYAMELFLRHYVDEDLEIYELFEEKKGYEELLLPQFLPKNEQILAWATEPYQSTAPYQENRIHKTLDGVLVRSKSEAMIASALIKYGIPYRYEPDILLGEITFHPDFIIKHPRTGKLFYIEHFGMIDNPNYARRMYDKLEMYNKHGIYQDVNLITFYETKNNPLNPLYIDQKIREFLENNV